MFSHMFSRAFICSAWISICSAIFSAGLSYVQFGYRYVQPYVQPGLDMSSRGGTCYTSGSKCVSFYMFAYCPFLKILGLVCPQGRCTKQLSFCFHNNMLRGAMCDMHMNSIHNLSFCTIIYLYVSLYILHIYIYIYVYTDGCVCMCCCSLIPNRFFWWEVGASKTCGRLTN